MDDMPRSLPPHVHQQTTRHGRVVFYFRQKHGRRIRLPAPGEPKFAEAYAAALAGQRISGRREAKAGTLAWLIERYRETAEWRGYNPGTRRSRDAVFAAVIKTAGHEQLARFTASVIEAGMARRGPGAAWSFLGALRPLFRWAVRAQHIASDPTAGVRRPALRKSGWVPWSDEEMAAFEAAYPVGTRERVVYDIARFTGLRRSDIARLGRPHVRDGVIRITTKKQSTRVTMSMHPTLAAHLASSPIGALTFVTTPDGSPMGEMALSQFFKRACRRIGITKSLHGLRKSVAEDAAEAGATDAQLMATFGWRDPRMASHYTREADRERLGLAGSRLLIGNGGGTENPSPSPQVRDLERKSE